MFSKLPRSVILCLTLILGKSQSSLLRMLLLFLFLFLFLLIFLLCICYTRYCWVTVLGYSLLHFFFSSLLFCFRKFYWYMLKLRGSFLSSVQSTYEHIKGILHSHYNDFFFVFSTLFDFLLGFCLLTLPTCSTLFTRILSILIKIVLNSWSDCFNIPAISVSYSDAYPVFQLSFLFFCFF